MGRVSLGKRERRWRLGALARLWACLPFLWLPFLMLGGCAAGVPGASPDAAATLAPPPAESAPAHIADAYAEARAGASVGWFHLGLFYEAGVDVPPDPARAAAYYRAARQAGATYFGPLLLVRLHTTGETALISAHEARHFARMAASAEPDAFLREVFHADLDRYFDPGWAPEAMMAPARGWCQGRADWSAVRLWRVGQRYWYGWGVPQARPMAQQLLDEAVHKGGRKGEPVLSFLYAEHLRRFETAWEPYDIPYTARQIRRQVYEAADAGLAAAERRLGRMFHRGDHVRRDLLAAYYWLWQARDGGSAVAVDLAPLWDALAPDQRILADLFIKRAWTPARYLAPR